MIFLTGLCRYRHNYRQVDALPFEKIFQRAPWKEGRPRAAPVPTMSRPESNPLRLEITAGSTQNYVSRSTEGLVLRTASIVRHDTERDTHLVLDDFGVDFVAWRKIGAERTDLARPLKSIGPIEGQQAFT